MFPEFSPTCQIAKDQSHLHIPIVADANTQAYAPLGWLCVQKVTQQQKEKAHTLWPPVDFKYNEEVQIDAFKMYVNQVRSGEKAKAKQLDMEINTRWFEFK